MLHWSGITVTSHRYHVKLINIPNIWTVQTLCLRILLFWGVFLRGGFHNFFSNFLKYLLPLPVRSSTSLATFRKCLKTIFLTWPSPHRHRHARWPVDVVELLHRFCRWALIWMSRPWAGDVGAKEIWFDWLSWYRPDGYSACCRLLFRNIVLNHKIVSEQLAHKNKSLHPEASWDSIYSNSRCQTQQTCNPYSKHSPPGTSWLTRAATIKFIFYLYMCLTTCRGRPSATEIS